MRASRWLAFFVAAVLAVPAWAGGRPRRFAKAGIQYLVPEGWRLTERGTRSNTITSQDGAASFTVLLLDAVDLKEGLRAIRKKATEGIQGFSETGRSSRLRLGGMSAVRLRGTGKSGQMDVELFVMSTGEDRAVGLVRTAWKVRMSRHKSAMDTIVKSVKRLRD